MSILTRAVRALGIAGVTIAVFSHAETVGGQTPTDQLYENFGAVPTTGLPAGFKTARFSSTATAPFVIASRQGRTVLTENGGQAQDVLYYKANPQPSLEESYSFIYTDPKSIVEPFLVNSRTGEQLSGFGTTISPSAPRNTSAGNEFYEYPDPAGGAAPLRAIKGRLRTEPYFFSVGHTYRVDIISDYHTHVLSTRVYDEALGPTVYDQSIILKPLANSKAPAIYPGIMNREGGSISVLDFAFGPAGSLSIRPHVARRAFDYLNYLGYNAGAKGADSSPLSLAFQKYFPALGISHVRVPAERQFLPTINAVSRFSIDADVLTGNKTTISGLQDFISSLARRPDSIELWNEPNNPSMGASYDSNFPIDLPAFASSVRTAFSGYNIWGPSILTDQNGYPNVAKRMAPALGPLVSAWNSHPYALDTPESTGYGGFIGGSCGVTMKEDCGWYGAANWNDNVSAVLNPSIPGVVTEGGASYGSYPSICGHTNVSLTAQQAYLQRGMLYGFKLGHIRIYPYKFIDDGKCTDGFGTYGIISRITRGDGSYEFSPKPAYTALVYLDRLLHDDGANAENFDPRPLEYALSEAGPDVEELLLAHSDGSYRLVLWSDSKLWDFNKNGPYRVGEDVAQKQEAVTVRFEKHVNAQAFTQEAGSGQWKAGAQMEATQSIPVTISQFPMVVDVRPEDAPLAVKRTLELRTDVPTPGPVETPSGKVFH